MAREISLGTDPRRMATLAGLGALLGCTGGVVAFLLVRLVGLVSNAALLGRFGTSLPDLRHYHPTLLLLPVALAGAAVVVLLARWSPVIKGHGIPESLEAIVQRESRVPPRVLVLKPLSAALAMGTGGPFGAEGPIIVTGGCIGSLLGQRLRVTPAERRILLATGAAAGMAGVFATPIAAVLIAFELLVFERSLRALLPLLLSTSIATALHTLLIGPRPLFYVRSPLAVPDGQLALFLVLGLAVGVLAVVLNKGLFAVEEAFRRLPVPASVHPLIGALGFACIGLAVPGSLSVGYWAISDSVNGRFLAGTAAVLLVGKLCSWWVALASGTSGGTLAPIFLIGGTMGDLIGTGFAHAFPGAHLDPAAFAVVAMGASFGVGARALLTGGVFALEVTGAWHLVLPMLLALAVGELVAEHFLEERLMTDKLVRRGLRVEFDTEVDPFRTAVARHAMDPLPARTGMGAARSGGAVAGRDGAAGPSRPQRTIDASAYLRDALGAFLDSDVDALVVTDGGLPVGLLRREVVREVLARRLAESVPQPPTLHWPWRVPSTGTRRDGVVPTDVGRVPRLDETHDGALTMDEDTTVDEDTTMDEGTTMDEETRDEEPRDEETRDEETRDEETRDEETRTEPVTTGDEDELPA